MCYGAGVVRDYYERNVMCVACRGTGLREVEIEEGRRDV